MTTIAVVGLAAAGAMAVFGLPPVDLHGPLHRMGIMDPLCGGTRATRYAAQGRWELAWRYNPLGIITVLGAAALLARTMVGFTTGRWINVDIAWTPRRRVLTVGAIVILLVMLEVRQQLRADLLIAGT